MSTVQVEYVGKKPFVVDNVARSGKTWSGTGDIQLVTPQQAKILTGYLDQWALVDGDDQKLLDAPMVIRLENEDGTIDQVDKAALKKNIEHMSATELAAYALEKYGKALKRNRGRTILLNEVIALENGADIV